MNKTPMQLAVALVAAVVTTLPFELVIKAKALASEI
jgi:hypothetical protein